MNQTALITGASKGIGEALAKKMLNENFVVIGTSRIGSIENIKHENFHSVKLDLSNSESIASALNEISSSFPQIDLLINNAGIGPDLETDKPEKVSFEQTFEINVNGTVFFTEGIIEHINPKGKIINISSKMGSIAVCTTSDSVAYRMSKSALNMYTKILTNRLKDKIDVASIHPGWVKTAISPSSLEYARLTPEASARSIYQFITSDFRTGLFWDAETNAEIAW